MGSENMQGKTNYKQHTTSDHMRIFNYFRECTTLKEISLFPISLIVIIYLSFQNFTLFHTVIEMYGIVIALIILVIAINTYHLNKDHYLLFLGIAYGFVAGFDFLHTLAYDGMNVFKESSTNLTTQLWIIARYIEGISILFFCMLMNKKATVKLKSTYVVTIYSIVSIALLLIVFKWNLFPVSFVEGVGVTSFKQISEYIISGMLAIAILLIIKNRNVLSHKIFYFLILSCVATIISEIMFIYFKHPDDLFVMWGHIVKIISFYFIYKVVVETALKTPYKKLKNSEERYSHLISVLPDGVLVHIGEKIVFVNSTLSKSLGMEEEELIGNSIYSIVSKEYHIEVREVIKKIRLGNSGRIGERLFLKKDGSHLHGEVTASTITFEGQEAILVIIRDMTERKKVEELEKTVEINQRLLQQVKKHVKLKTEFFSNLSHEMRTPLNVIFGTIQLLEVKLQVGEGVAHNKHLMVIKQNCYRMLRLVNNLLDTTKIDAGYFQLDLGNYNIISIVEDITTSVVDYAEENHVSLIFDTEIEEKIMAIDPDALERIVLNLLSNAIKFTEEGDSVFVNIHDEGEHIVIRVKDTGIGIPKQQIDTIFRRFKQVDKSFSKEHQGTGIGLSLVNSLVRMHGGKMDVQSTYGEGTEFIIQLPVKVLNEEVKTDKNHVNTTDEKAKQVERIQIEFSDIYTAK